MLPLLHKLNADQSREICLNAAAIAQDIYNLAMIPSLGRTS